MGRPSSYTQEIGDSICERLADGESLRSICASEDMPNRATVFRWLGQDDAFRDQYARAREEQADALADDIVEISDEADVVAKADGEEVRLALDPTAVARNRLRVDARKWVAAKLKPKKYGDRQVLAGDPEAPLHGLSDADLDARIAEKLGKVNG